MGRRAVLLLALLLAPLVARPAIAQQVRTVAILPLVVHALEDTSYLRSGLADMLASRLGQTPGVGVIRLDDPAVATTDPEVARTAGRDVGADWVLFGSFTRFGDGASLDVRCLPVAGPEGEDARSIFVQAGRLGEIIPRLDELSEKVGRYVTTGADGAAPVAAGPPGRAGNAGLDALAAELSELQGRVEKLESESVREPVVERDLGSN